MGVCGIVAKVVVLALVLVGLGMWGQQVLLTPIPAGQAAAVWERDGSVEVLEGPRLVMNVHRRIDFLPRYTASPKEYLIVRFVNGTVRHVPGPCAVRFHPLHHSNISTRKATTITANEVLVVYRRNKSGEVERHVVRGPGVHVPTSDEWLHEFTWHGSDPRNKAKKIKKGRQFTKLRIVPTQMYYDVDSIRSSDDAMITVMLMIFFELHDLESMLDLTHDPIGDFINAVSADVVKFAANRTYEELSLDADKLNNLATYPQLTNRAKRIGYSINKVVYRGYRTTSQLQRMHDDSIETRTQLRLRKETESEAQQIKDMVQSREMLRAALEREEHVRKVNHTLRIQRQQHEERIHQETTRSAAAVHALKEKHEAKAAFFTQLKGIGIDVTQVLVAQSSVPDKVVRVQTDDMTTSAAHDVDVAAAIHNASAAFDFGSLFHSSHSSSTHPDREDAVDEHSEEQRRAERRERRRRSRQYHPDRKASNLHLHIDE